MPDKEYRIRIATVADPSGLRETSSGLSDVTEQTKKGTSANEEHHKSFLHVGSGAKEFHRLLHTITEESPMLGLALKLAISPVGGALVAAIALFRELKQAEEASLKAAEENAQQAAQGFGDMKQSIFEAKEEVAKHNREYTTWLENLTSGTNAVKDSLSEELQLIQETAAAYEQVLQQQKELSLAKIAEAERSGQITKEQSIVEEAEVERRFAHQESAVKIDKMRADFAAKGKALMQTSGQMVALGGEQGGLQTAAEDVGRAAMIKDLPKRVQSAEKQAEDFQKAMEKADKALTIATEKAAHNEQIRQAIGTQDNEGRERDSKAVQKATEEFERYRNLRDGEKRLAEESRKKLSELTAEQEKANAALDRSKKQFSELDSQFQSLSRELESLRIKLSVQGPASGTALKIGDEAAGARTFGKLAGTDIGKMLFAQGGGAVDAAFDIMHGKGIARGGSEDQMLTAFQKSMGLNDQMMAKWIIILSDAHSSLQGLAHAQDMIQKRFEELKSRTVMRNLPGGQP